MEVLTTVDVTKTRNFPARAGPLASLSWDYSECHNYTLIFGNAEALEVSKGLYFKCKSRNTFLLRDCSAQQYKKELII